MPGAVSEEDRDTAKDENCHQAEGLHWEGRKGGGCLLLRGAATWGIQRVLSMGNTTDKSVKEETFCTGQIMPLEPEVKCCMNILWELHVVYSAGGRPSPSLPASLPQSPADAGILTVAKPQKQISHNGSITDWLGDVPLNLPLHPTKKRNTVSILYYYFKSTSEQWCGKLSSGKVQKSLNIDISKRTKSILWESRSWNSIVICHCLMSFIFYVLIPGFFDVFWDF